MRRWPDDIETLLENPLVLIVRDAGGGRTHWRAALQAAAVPSGSSVTSVLARNRTWTSTFAGLHANPAHPEDVNLLAARRGVEPRLAVSKTAVRIRHTRRLRKVSRPGFEPGPGPSEDPMQSATPSGHTEPTTGFAPASAANQIDTAKTGAFFSRATSATQHEREELNPVKQFWRLPALPGAHSCMLPIPQWAARVSEGS